MLTDTTHAPYCALPALLPSPVLAEGFLISPPLKCDLETDAISTDVDSDPFTDCVGFHVAAGLLYDGHKGTGLRAPDRARINDNIPCLPVPRAASALCGDGICPIAAISSATADDIRRSKNAHGVVAGPREYGLGKRQIAT